MSDSRLNDLFDQFRKELEGLGLGSLDEANGFAATFMKQQNTHAIDDFCGLSPEAMHRFLHHPFDSPKYLEFPTRLATPIVDCQFLELFLLLSAKLSDKGVKATTKGNLPRNLVRDIAIESMSGEDHQSFAFMEDIRTEPDFGNLHSVRLVAELAGLIRKVRNQFILSAKCKSLLDKGPESIYPVLLKTFLVDFNWQYLYSANEVQFIQQAAPFSLYLLGKFGEDWREPSFYDNAFMRAFPKALSLVDPKSHRSNEEQLTTALLYTNIHYFLKDFGLAETLEQVVGNQSEVKFVRKTPLLDAVVKFRVS